MTETNRKTARAKDDGERATGGVSEEQADAPETAHVCNVAFCPIGLALTAVQPMKPDVVEHLLVAGRELFLAAKALLEVRADDLDGGGAASAFEKIDIG